MHAPLFDRWPTALHAAARRVCLVALAAAAALPGVALAQEDPPGRVGRIASTEGTVWIYDIDAQQWEAAPVNRPLTSGDQLSSEGGARAEVRIGSTVLRIGERSRVEFVQIDDHVLRIRLHDGRLAVRTATAEAARELVLVTAEGRFAPLGPAHLRLDRSGSTSSLTVWHGTARFESDDSALDVSGERRADFWREAGRTHYTWREAPRDAFTAWVAEADRRDASAPPPRYVSPEMTGAEDLERHGRWIEHGEYGPLWLPYTVAPGWVPYRYGHWAWVSPWGWTWVDDAPWGFAPFHYGRWVWFRGAWGWAPGAYVARPVYAPALVAWVGTPGVGVSVQIGAHRPPPPVGWFPLAPRDIYVPPYRATPIHMRAVNVTHVPYVDPAVISTPARAAEFNRYANRGITGAMTIVPRDAMRPRQPIAPVARPADHHSREWGHAPTRIEAPITPPGRALSPNPQRPNGAPARSAPPPGVPQPPQVVPQVMPQAPQMRPRNAEWPPAPSGPSGTTPVPAPRAALPDAEPPRPAAPPRVVVPQPPAAVPVPPQVRPMEPARPMEPVRPQVSPSVRHNRGQDDEWPPRRERAQPVPQERGERIERGNNVWRRNDPR
jgi:hypothetical protein